MQLRHFLPKFMAHCYVWVVPECQTTANHFVNLKGHETTSGLLSFQFYFLLKNPEAYRKAQEEVDAVIGNDTIQPQHINKLQYIQAMLRETLRLQPTAPAFSVGAKANQGEILGGKYHVEKDESVVASLHKVQRDPAVYGEDAEEWKPERMLDE